MPVRLARFDIPEVSERSFALAGAASLETGDSVAVVADVSADQPEHGNSWDRDELDFGLPLGITMSVTGYPFTEIRYTQLSPDFGYLSLKYQFYGASRERSEKGNASWAATLAYGLTKAEDAGSYEQASELIGWDTETDARTVDIGLVGGYRVARRTLLYGGPYIQRTEVSTRLTRGSDTNGTTITRLDNTLFITGANVGVEFGFGKERGFVLGIELGRAWMSWDRIGFEDRSGQLSFRTGYHF